jgi:hypothetical protein
MSALDRTKEISLIIITYYIAKYNATKRDRKDSENIVRALIDAGQIGKSTQIVGLASEYFEAFVHVVFFSKQTNQIS